MNNENQEILAYVPLERIAVQRPVDRFSYIRSSCAGKVVLDLGAMDETAYFAKRGSGTWLHEEMARTSKQVIGLDNSEHVPANGLNTGDNSVIYRGDIGALNELLLALQVNPDMIVAGELIEHVESPLMFLRALKSIEALSGKRLLLTTPNATALHNCLIGLFGRESTHHDHLCILSYKTLSTLMIRAGFKSWQIYPYFARFTEMRLRQHGAKRAIATIAEKVINALEWCFPLMSFGYIVDIEI